MEVLFEKSGQDFNKYLEDRKEFAAGFVIRAIKGGEAETKEIK